MQLQSRAIETLAQQDALQLRGKSLLSMADLNREQILGILEVAQWMCDWHRRRENPLRYAYPRSLAMIFEKPSLRTRVTFELGMRQLGGAAVALGPAEIGLGTRESVPDVARNLERWVDAIMARVHAHSTLVQLRDNCRIPVINGLSDREHPCQILADLLTIQQKKGRLEGLKLAWIGDGNNVLHSLLLGCAPVGISVSAACPKGYWPLEEIVRQARQLAGENPDADPNASSLKIMTDYNEAVAGADIVYTDVWTSMGHEHEQLARIQAFRAYQVNAERMSRAAPDAIFMHCLPAHRGDEVTDEVVDGPQSVVFDQAENRLHAQKAILLLLMGMAAEDVGLSGRD
jgi:ornithine carbamoyltransferase